MQERSNQPFGDPTNKPGIQELYLGQYGPVLISRRLAKDLLILKSVALASILLLFHGARGSYDFKERLNNKRSYDC